MKHAKTMLVAAACAASLSFALQVSGADDTPEAEWKPWENTTEAERVEWAEIAKLLTENGRSAFPDLARLIDKTYPGSWELDGGVWRLDQMDGMDFLTRGDPDLLASVRRLIPVLLDYDKRHKTMSLRHGLYYLSKKGDARDFPLFEKYLEDPVFRKTQSEMFYDERGVQYDIYPKLSIPYRILQHRVAGTNIVRGTFDTNFYPYFNPLLPAEGNSYSTNDLHFIPSIANTGPQAAYVYEALEQVYLAGRNVEYESPPYSVITNIAPELLTMRVWFDADGKAVCDVDLAKYGISVPGLGMATNAPPPLEPPPAAADATITAETSVIPQPQPSAAPSAQPCPVSLVAVGAGVLAAVLVLLAALWRKRQRR